MRFPYHHSLAHLQVSLEAYAGPGYIAACLAWGRSIENTNDSPCAVTKIRVSEICFLGEASGYEVVDLVGRGVSCVRYLIDLSRAYAGPEPSSTVQYHKKLQISMRNPF